MNQKEKSFERKRGKKQNQSLRIMKFIDKNNTLNKSRKNTSQSIFNISNNNTESKVLNMCVTEHIQNKENYQTLKKFKEKMRAKREESRKSRVYSNSLITSPYNKNSNSSKRISKLD